MLRLRLARQAFSPGDLLYAGIDTGVNSDVTSAVMTTVASGKLKNARLLGKFQRFEERLVLSFSRVILSDGSDAQMAMQDALPLGVQRAQPLAG